MRYRASAKLEIINLVEQSHLSASRTLKTLGVSRSTFYRWYDRLETGAPEALQRFISYYNHEHYHESLDNLTPADVYYGRGQEILDQRHTIKLDTLAMRRKIHYDKQNNLHLMS